MTKPPKTVRTLKGIAALISSHFGIPCDRQTINYWQKGWKSGTPFPMPGDNNEFDVAACFAWVEKNVIKGKIAQTEPELDLFRRSEQARQQQKITSAEREQLELDKEKGLYVLKDVAYQTIVAALTLFKSFVRDEMEKRAVVERREKLKALGASDEIAGQFFVWDKEREIALIDAIEKRCEQEANGDHAISI